MYIWASPRTRQPHSVPLNRDQKFITFILLPNSGLFYKSKWGTHSEPSSLKPARKEVNDTSLSPPWALVCCLHLDEQEVLIPTASPLHFYWGRELSNSGKEKGKGPCKPHRCRLLHRYHPLWYLDLPSTFCCYSSWQACCLQNLLTKSVYQSFSRTPGGGTQPTNWVTQLWHLSDFSLNSNLAKHVLSFPDEKVQHFEHLFCNRP